MKGKGYLLVLVILFSLTLSSVTALDDSNDAVNSTEVINVEGHTLDDVSDAIEGAGEDSVVELEGTYLANTSREVNIYKSLTIQASQNGATIDLNGSFHEFKIGDYGKPPKDVTFKGIRFVNSGEISLTFTIGRSSNLTFINCAFENTSPAFTRNGGIYNGSVNIIDSNFSDVSRSITGSSDNFDSFNIYNSRFTNFESEVISIIEGNTEFNILNSYFENMERCLSLYNVNSNLINNTFCNILRRAVAVDSGQSNISKNTFKKIRAEIDQRSLYVDSDNLIFENNTFEELSWSFYIKTQNLNLSALNINGINGYGIIIADNLAFDSSNIRDADFYYEAKKLEVTNSKFHNSDLTCNDAGKLSECRVFNSQFDFRSILSAQNAAMTISHCNITDESAVASNRVQLIEYCNYERDNAGFFGDMNIKNTNFRNMELNFMNAGSIKIDNSTFTKISAVKIFCRNVEITDSRFSDNAAGDVLVYVEGKNLKVTGNVFNANRADLLVMLNCRNEFSTASVAINNNIIAANYGTNNRQSMFRCNFYDNRGTDHCSEVKSINYANNFYGYNIADFWEIEDEFFFAYQSPTAQKWVNLQLNPLEGNTYQLKFVDNAGNTVGLKEYKFSIKDKKTGAVIASDILVKDGIGSFTSETSVTMDDVCIFTEASTLVNKPVARVELSTSGNDYGNFRLIVKLYDENGNPIKNANFEITTYYLDSKKVVGSQRSFGNTAGGISTNRITFSRASDSHNFLVRFHNQEFGLSKASISNIRLDQIQSKASAKNLLLGYHKAPYSVIEDAIKFKPDVDGFTLLIYKGSKLVKKDVMSRYWLSDMADDFSELSRGTYRVVMETHASKFHKFQKTSFKLKIVKSASVKAPKIVSKYKKSKYFKITVKVGKKPLKKVKVKVKVFTGKNYKVYALKTNRKGVASLNVKKLKKGKHNVQITSSYSNAFIYKTSKITIK